MERVNKKFLCHIAGLINVFILQEQILEISSADVKRIYATHVEMLVSYLLRISQVSTCIVFHT